MNISNLNFNKGVFLAPMAGVTDYVFRKICRSFGAELTYTEMVSAKALHYNSKRTEELLFDEGPFAVQLFGHEPEIMAEAALRVSKIASIIDINMGCPTPKIVNNQDGCALMKNPKLAGEIVKAVKSATKVPTTVKIRKGWDEKSVNALLVAKIVEENGADALTVHGRTREQFYSGKADYEIIKEIKESVKIPVIGNGDIFSAQDAKLMQEQTGCDGIMVARGAMGNPWIFESIIKGESEPTEKDRLNMALMHTKQLVEYKGESIGIREARKHIAWYLKGVKNSAGVRRDVNTKTTLEEMENLILNL